MMKRTFVVVGGVPTKVITTGSKGLQDAPKRLVLVIPGNPGLAGYYETFMGSQHERMGGEPDKEEDRGGGGLGGEQSGAAARGATTTSGAGGADVVVVRMSACVV